MAKHAAAAPPLRVGIPDVPCGQKLDPTLSADQLAGLGARLKLPAGWTFSTRVLDAELEVRDVDGVAVVVQDDFENTYQLVA